ncbi:hypothetical protein [Streptomyces sp. SM11]|uniref:hypothetical protein n=1 Tax=Streptomyces sp. SM11 TaxID=565557 RepID=UPI0035BC261E
MKYLVMVQCSQADYEAMAKAWDEKAVREMFAFMGKINDDLAESGELVTLNPLVLRGRPLHSRSGDGCGADTGAGAAGAVSGAGSARTRSAFATASRRAAPRRFRRAARHARGPVPARRPHRVRGARGVPARCRARP